jgi:chorismate mutase
MAEERALDGKPNVDDAGAGVPQPDPSGVRARVEELRQQIDDLDERIVALLSARASCALEVGREKKRLGLDLYQPSRESEVLGHVQRVNQGPLNDAAIKRLFERIIDEARRLEREAEVGHSDDGNAHRSEP